MSGKTDSPKKKMKEQVQPEAQQLEEEIEKIKHPPGINEDLKEQTPAERASNPTLVPEMLDDMRDLRGDLERD